MKEYIQHPETIPLRVEQVKDCVCENFHGSEKVNGLSFVSNNIYPANSVIKIKMIVEGQIFESYCKVSHIKKMKNDLYKIEIDFDEKIDPFQIKMIQQICQIIDYSSQKGIKRELAADKWIKENAEKFNAKNYSTKRRARI